MSLFSREDPVLSSKTLVGPYKAQNQEFLVVPLVATSASQNIFIAPNFPTTGTTRNNASYFVVGITVVFGTASSSGTLQLEHLTGTQAAGGGTALLASTISLAGTANTVLTGTLATTVTAAQGTISPGDRLGIVLAGTMTGLANCVVEVVLAIA